MNETLYETAFDGATVDEIEAALWRLLSQGQWPVDAAALTEVVVELADNAILHSGEGDGWCSVQHGDRPRQQLTVVIADRGVGIPYRVNQVVEDRKLDDYQALRLAFQRRFSSTGDPHRGFGLNIVLDYTGCRDRCLAWRVVMPSTQPLRVEAGSCRKGLVRCRASRPDCQYRFPFLV